MGRCLAGGLALGIALTAAVSAAVQETGAIVVVRKLNEALVDILKQSGQLKFEERYQRLSPVLNDAFDLAYMGRAAVGRQWDKLSAEDQARWVEKFKQLTTATYASRFQGYSGQQFETISEETAANDTVIVHTRVIDPGNENVDVDYRLRQISAGWRIVDVYLKGSVSEVALRRSEYAAVLQRDGFAALLTSVDQKIAALAAGSQSP